MNSQPPNKLLIIDTIMGIILLGVIAFLLWLALFLSRPVECDNITLNKRAQYICQINLTKRGPNFFVKDSQQKVVD